MDAEGHSTSAERDPMVILDVLRRHWGPIFTDQPIDETAAQDYIDQHLPDFPAPRLEVPSLDALRAAFRRARPTAPGPDRLRAAAWLVDDRLTDVLHDLMLALLAGRPAPWGLNFADMVFVPKGTDPTDILDVTRHASKLRPLSLKNSDVKALAATVNAQLGWPPSLPPATFRLV